MKTIVAFLVLSSVLATSVSAGFKVSEFVWRRTDGVPFLELSYGESSGGSFAEVIRVLYLHENGLDIRLLGEFDRRTQDELIAYYKEAMPSDLEAALASTGNMHNPAIQPLASSFDSAFRQTSMFRDIEEQLAPRGLVVKEITHEKFNMPGGDIWVPDISIEVKPHAQSH